MPVLDLDDVVIIHQKELPIVIMKEWRKLCSSQSKNIYNNAKKNVKLRKNARVDKSFRKVNEYVALIQSKYVQSTHTG